ncbi:MAG: carboxypeptidase-like regulatory domain-containing protein [Limisphaerales bacterium]
MKTKLTTVALCLAWSVTALGPQLYAANNGQTTRTLQGQVMRNSEAPLPGAVVFLKNTKTLAVRSFISDNKGNYRFTSLSPNIDYEVHAEYQGQKSDTKTLSSFDSKTTATINLKVGVN